MPTLFLRRVATGDITMVADAASPETVTGLAGGEAYEVFLAGAPVTAVPGIVNAVPVAAGALGDLSLTLGQPMTPVDVSGDFADPGDTLAFAAAGLPAGLVLSGAGVLSGTPTAEVTGQTVTVTATDSAAQTATSAFGVTVGAAPSVTAAPAVSGTAEIGQTLTGSDGSWSGTAPVSHGYRWIRDGAPVAGAVGTSYTLTPADEGAAMAFEVTATNGFGTAAAASPAVTALWAAPMAAGGIADQALTLGAAMAALDVAGDFAVAGDPAGASLGFALAPSSAALPAGLALSAAGVLSGIPGETVTGRTIVVRASNSGGVADTGFQIDVAPAFTGDPDVTAIQADGWRASHSAVPAEFDPVGDPRHVTVTRQGFDAAGSAITFDEDVLLTKRVRQPYPNQATLTASDVALADFVYAGDTVAGVTNASTRAYPKPIALWLNHDLERATAATHTVRLAVAHAHARAGRPVAAVRFTVTDDQGGSHSVLVSAMSVVSYTASGLSVPHFAATLDLSGLAQGALCTVDATIYPWVGEAFMVSTDADAYPSPNLTVLKLLNDRTGGYGTAYAYVDAATGDNGTGAVSETPATAAAAPFATIAAAASAVQSFNNATYGRNNASGGVIRLTEAAVHTHSSFSGVAVDDIPLVIENDPANSGKAVYQDAGSSTSNSIPDILKFSGITLRRNASGNVIFLDNAASSSPGNRALVLSDCTFDDNGLGASWGAWIYKVARMWPDELRR